MSRPPTFEDTLRTYGFTEQPAPAGDILDRIDATVAGRCPCGADPVPGSAWCSEDCRPDPGVDAFGPDAVRWSPEPPPVGGLCPCGCGLSMAEIMDWVLVEPVVEEGGRTAVLGAPGGGNPEGRTAPTRVSGYRYHVVPDGGPEIDAVASILAGEPLERWEARQVRDDRLVEGCEALLGHRLPEWMRRVLNGWWRASTAADASRNP